MGSPTFVPGAIRYALGQLKRRVVVPVTITEPPSDALVEWNVAVPMRDGVLLRVNVFRPDDDDVHPVLLCAHPYGKDRLPRRRRFRSGYRTPMQYHLMQSGPVSHSAWTGWEAPDPAHWVSRGYVVVNADLRGLGQIRRGRGSLFSDQEGLDCHDLIEWAAVQPWSNVGSGCPVCPTWRSASGPPRPPVHRTLRRSAPGRASPTSTAIAPGPAVFGRTGSSSMWTIGLRVSERRRIDIARQARTRPEFDSWWAQRNRAVENIDGTSTGLRQLLRPQPAHQRLFRGLPPNRLGAQVAVHPPRTEVGDLLFRAGTADPGGILRPLPPRRRDGDPGPVRPSGSRYGRTPEPSRRSVGQVSWPPPDTDWQRWYLAVGTDTDDGTLRPTAASSTASRSFDIRRGQLRFTYRFDSDTEMVGPMLLTVTISVTDTDDVELFAGVRKFRGGREIGFEGSYGFPFDLVTHGMLVASHRQVDPIRSLPHQPFHPHTEPEPLTAGGPGRTADRIAAVRDAVPGRRRTPARSAGPLVLLPQSADRSVSRPPTQGRSALGRAPSTPAVATLPFSRCQSARSLRPTPGRRQPVSHPVG